MQSALHRTHVSARHTLSFPLSLPYTARRRRCCPSSSAPSLSSPPSPRCAESVLSTLAADQQATRTRRRRTLGTRDTAPLVGCRCRSGTQKNTSEKNRATNRFAATCKPAAAGARWLQVESENNNRERARLFSPLFRPTANRAAPIAKRDNQRRIASMSAKKTTTRILATLAAVG